MKKPTRLSVSVVAALALGVLCCCGGVSAYFFDTNSTASKTGVDASCTIDTTIAVSGVPGLPFSDTEEHNAATIVTVGENMNVAPRGWVIAVATAMQESHLRNLPDLGASNDHDSLGLFQQRPSQGWGTPAQILDPTYAATKFYTKLLTVKNWQTLALTDAAQAVQRSAFPGAYAKWESDATQLVGALVAGNAAVNPTTGSICNIDGGDLQVDNGAVSLPAGFSLPPGTPRSVVTAISWALDQIGTPYSFGGDCTSAHSGDPAHQCDCSSLTMMSYRAGGVAIPRLAADQSRFGAPIYDLRDLQAGDLVFLVGSDGTRQNPGHVGMYLGEGVIIEAPHTGTLVKLTTLGAWANLIVAARRVVTNPA